MYLPGRSMGSVLLLDSWYKFENMVSIPSLTSGVALSWVTFSLGAFCSHLGNQGVGSRCLGRSLELQIPVSRDPMRSAVIHATQSWATARMQGKCVTSISKKNKLCMKGLLQFLLEDLGFKVTPTGSTGHYGTRARHDCLLKRDESDNIRPKKEAGQRGQRDRRNFRRLGCRVVVPCPL